MTAPDVAVAVERDFPESGDADHLRVTDASNGTRQVGDENKDDAEGDADGLQSAAEFAREHDPGSHASPRWHRLGIPVTGRPKTRTPEGLGLPPATWCRWGGPAADWSDVDQSDDALTVTGGGLRTFHSMRFATELRRRLRGTDRGRGRSRSGIQVKAWEETRTFVEPQHPSYRQADPHVWFAAAGATQRGGFRGHREAADRVFGCAANPGRGTWA